MVQAIRDKNYEVGSFLEIAVLPCMEGHLHVEVMLTFKSGEPSTGLDIITDKQGLVEIAKRLEELAKEVRARC